jgi:hypothetical protein
MSKNELKALVWQEGDLFVAKAIGIEVESQGKSRKEAIKNLAEAVNLFLEDEHIEIPDNIVPENPEVTSIYA